MAVVEISVIGPMPVMPAAMLVIPVMPVMPTAMLVMLAIANRSLTEHIEATRPRSSAAGSDQDDVGSLQCGGIPHYHPHDLRHRRISLWH
ncbi:MAG: hypothetical protein ACRDO9_03095, partial [Gaiellales bacterium]